MCVTASNYSPHTKNNLICGRNNTTKTKKLIICIFILNQPACRTEINYFRLYWNVFLDFLQQKKIISDGQLAYRRHMSVPLDVGATSDGANLQKATSLSRAELEARLQRPKFVPEKLDFRLYEKFEGKCQHFNVNCKYYVIS